jgi:hypothetical protein
MGSEAGESPQQMEAAASSAETALNRAAADLAAKEQEVRRDQAIAESIANLAKDQQSAAEMIARQAADLAQTPPVEAGTPPTMAQQSAAQKLNEAQLMFADAQQATGQGAVELSGQTQVANQPLREALELASNLPALGPLAEMPADGALPIPADGQPMPADGQPAGEAQPAGDGQPKPADGQQGQPAQPAAGQPKSPNSLGTGFVPQSPQVTAQMMAGPQAQAMQQALAQAQAQAQQGQPGPSGQSSPLQPMPNQPGQPVPSQTNSTQLAKKDGVATTNQKVKESPVQKLPEGTEAGDSKSNKAREKEEGILARQLKDEAWFAKLPPELRKSIRAGAGQKPPRAYEERLKKYFESVD